MKKLFSMALIVALAMSSTAHAKTNQEVSMDAYGVVLKIVPICKEYLKVQANNHLVAYLAKHFKKPEEVIIAAMICHAHRTGFVDNMIEEQNKKLLVGEDGEGS